MELRISPEVEAKLARIAGERGQNTEAVIQEAILKLLEYEDWFSREVDEGLAAADRGELVGHEEIGKLIERRYPG